MKTFEGSNNLNNLNMNHDNQLSWTKFFIFLVAALLIGGAAGFGIAKFSTSKNTAADKAEGSITTAKAEKTIGLADKKAFKDQAEGTLREGGIDGEGNFHLERAGGTSQNVYLTSTTVDLSPHIGKKVRVWGQTFTAEKAGWLMDVGLVEILQ